MPVERATYTAPPKPTASAAMLCSGQREHCEVGGRRDRPSQPDPVDRVADPQRDHTEDNVGDRERQHVAGRRGQREAGDNRADDDEPGDRLQARSHGHGQHGDRRSGEDDARRQAADHVEPGGRFPEERQSDQCRGAAVEDRADAAIACHDAVRNGKPSRRVRESEHDADGNRPHRGIGERPQQIRAAEHHQRAADERQHGDKVGSAGRDRGEIVDPI
jgi:hypothetical protein